jgi:hypothetical protein
LNEIVKLHAIEKGKLNEIVKIQNPSTSMRIRKACLNVYFSPFNSI